MFQVFAGWRRCTLGDQVSQGISLVLLLAGVITIFWYTFKKVQQYNSKFRGGVYDITFLVLGFIIASIVSAFLAVIFFLSIPWCG